MLRLLKNTTFLTAVHRASDIMKNVKAIFETSDTRLLDALCDVKTWRKNYVRQKYSKWLWRKISGLSLSIVSKLPEIDGSIKYGVLLLGNIFLHGPVSVSLQCYLVFSESVRHSCGPHIFQQ